MLTFRHGKSPTMVAVGLFIVTSLWACADSEFREAREAMVDHIEQSGPGYARVDDEDVLDAMRTVRRHEFVPKDLRSMAYADRPLPIGYGQTISQPYIVALMTQLLEVDEDDTVLEIGTGSGYQAAILAELVDTVCTIEIIEALAKQAKDRFEEMKIDNVVAKQGDGYFGWRDYGPFDAIIVTAASSHIPPPLLEQLKPGGKMVIPVGAPLQAQTLLLVEKNEDGTVQQRNILPVQFVPFTRTRDES